MREETQFVLDSLHVGSGWLTTSHRHHVTITFILFPRTVRDWNILPEAVVRASSPEVFRGGSRITQAVSWYSNDNRCREPRP